MFSLNQKLRRLRGFFYSFLWGLHSFFSPCTCKLSPRVKMFQPFRLDKYIAVGTWDPNNCQPPTLETSMRSVEAKKASLKRLGQGTQSTIQRTQNPSIPPSYLPSTLVIGAHQRCLRKKKDTTDGIDIFADRVAPFSNLFQPTQVWFAHGASGIEVSWFAHLSLNQANPSKSLFSPVAPLIKRTSLWISDPLCFH